MAHNDKHTLTSTASSETSKPRVRSKSKSIDDENPVHVQFQLSQDEISHHHDNIEIKKIAKHLYDVHLGYLKVDHSYRITFKLEQDFDELIHLKENSSKNVTLEEFKRLNDGSYEFTFLFYAYKEKLDKEQVTFSVKDGKNEQSFCINFEAKVLGVNQGTPLLRNGVTLVAHKHSHSDKASSGHYSFM